MADVSTLLAADLRAGEQINQELDELVAQLRRSIVFRSLDDALRLLRSHRTVLESVGPCTQGGGILLGLAAFWTSSRQPVEGDLVSSALVRYEHGACAELSLTECAYIAVARGFTTLHSDPPAALQRFAWVKSVETDLLDRLVLFLGLFGIARVHRLEGKFEESARWCDEAAAIARAEQWYGLLGALDVFSGWVQLLLGSQSKALEFFDRAQPLLINSVDSASLGDLHSGRGRIARAQGKYQAALEEFERASAAYRLRKPTRSKYAQALANIALTERLMANEPNPPRKPKLLRQSALRHCLDSETVYRRHRNQEGLGWLQLIRASLYFDLDDLERARQEAEEALKAQGERENQFLVTRGLILLSLIENKRLETDAGNAGDRMRRSSRAQRLALEAVELARRAESRHLVARAYLCQALTACNLGEIPEALDLSEKGASLVTPEISGLVREDLARLRKRLSRAATVEAKFRDWSLGVTGNRAYQQIADDFEDIVIRTVWEKEHRDAARVAKKLSLSPRHVSRVLKRLGLLPISH